MFQGQSTSLRELLGDPFGVALDKEISGQAFIFRLMIALPLITGPTALLLWSRLPFAHAPVYAQAATRLWTTLAIAYLVANALGAILYPRKKSSTTLLEGLTLLCLFIEVGLTTVCTYLLGLGALSFSCFVVILVVGYRIYFNYSLGIVTTVLVTISWLLVAAQDLLGLPLGPSMPQAGLAAEIKWEDCLFACGTVFCGFVVSNVGANRIHKLRAQLEATQHQLIKQARAGAVANLVTGIAHELGNPLNLVRGGIDNISDEIEDSPQDFKTENANWLKRLQTSVDIAERGTRRIHTLVGSLNELTPSGPTQDGSSNVAQTFQLTQDMLKRQLDEHEQSITGNIPPELIAPLATTELAQIFFNLISNAIQATPPQGQILVEAQQDGQTVIIDVKDTGPGVANHLQSQVFDAFMTTHAEAKGLGLTISQQIATAAKGTLELLPTESGAHFQIKLPIAPQIDN